MNVLVTGSSGYIASHLIPKLVSLGHRVSGLDRVSGDPRQLSRFVHGDLLDETVARKSLEGIDCVLHLAAAKADWGLTQSEYYRDNLEATRTLLAAGREKGIHKWVFFSTVSVLGPSESPIDETAGMNPFEPYGRSKAEAELLFHRLAKEEPGAEVLILRPSVVFGPGNPSSTNVYRLIDGLFRRRFVMVGEGRTIKTTSYIENLVEATGFLLARMKGWLSIYIYVDAPLIETRELVLRLCRLLNRRPPRFRVPLGLAAALAVPADLVAKIARVDLPITRARIRKFCRSTVFDAQKIRSVGFRQPVDNDVALARTVEWYLDCVAGRKIRPGTIPQADRAGR